MKHWDDILGKRLRGFRGKDVPGQADAIWDNIDMALGAPPTLSVPFWKRNAFQLALAAAIAAAVVIGMAVRQDLTPSSPSPTSGVERTTEGIIEGTTAGSAENAASESTIASENASNPTEPVPQSKGTANAKHTSKATTNQTASPGIAKAAPANETNHSARSLSAAESLSANTNESERVTTSKNNTGPLATPKVIDASANAGPSVLPLVNHSFSEDDHLKTPFASVIDEKDTGEKSSDNQAALAPLRPLDLRGAASVDSPLTEPLLLSNFTQESGRKTLTIRAFTGPTWSQFSIVDNPSQSDYFLSDVSAGGGLMFEFEGARPWSIGLSWNNYIHNLQYTEITETPISMFGPINVVVDIQTGDTLSITEGIVSGVEERTRFVDHHNRFQAIAIPIEWRQVKSINALQFGVGLGATLQFRSGASGSILNAEGQVVRYANANLSRSRIAVVPNARAFTGLRFAPAWRLDLGLSVGVQRHISRSDADSPAAENPSWQGRLIHGQIQFGLSRFVSRLRP